MELLCYYTWQIKFLLLLLRIKEMVVVRHAKLQSKCHRQQTNTQVFYRPDALPVTQSTVWEH